MWQRKLRKIRIFIILKNILLILFGIALLFSLAFFFLDKFLFNSISIISPLSKNITKTQNLQELLEKNNIQFSKISKATDSSYLVFLKENGVVNMSQTKDVGKQISSLQLILTRLTIEGKRFKRLDLRFEKPVIVF